MARVKAWTKARARTGGLGLRLGLRLGLGLDKG